VSVNGYTVVDLTAFSAFSIDYSLNITIRNTLPGNFSCSGEAVPFSTAEYTNEDGAGGGLMGPYVPLVDYVDPSNLPRIATVVAADLPSAGSCGVLVTPPSGSQVYPLLNTPGSTSQINWPAAYWPAASTNPPYLNCGTTASTAAPQINFVATQFPIPVDDRTNYSGSPTNCTSAYGSNSCSQIVAQSTQVTELAGGAVWQPGLPIKIVGQGFGNLSFNQSPQQIQIPAVLTLGTSPNYLEVYDCPSGSLGPGQTCATWSAPSASCQIYVGNWTDSTISLVVNLPNDAQSMYELANERTAYLSPLSDFGLLTFPAATGCSLAAGDELFFAVTNPQTLVQATTVTGVTVLATGSASLK
jgi:hypothetical protein